MSIRAWVLVVLVIGGCNGNKDDLYESCEQPSDCTAQPEESDPACLPKADEGYCTWTCEDDAACGSSDLVCASFESENEMYCFPACNEAPEDDETECPEGFGCRSTGGGNNNRKICFPEA